MLRIFDMMLGVFYIGRVEVFTWPGEVRCRTKKGTWVYLVTSAGAYGVYLAIILGRVADTPVADVSYAAVLLWTAGASIVASIVGRPS